MQHLASKSGHKILRSQFGSTSFLVFFHISFRPAQESCLTNRSPSTSPLSTAPPSAEGPSRTMPPCTPHHQAALAGCAESGRRSFSARFALCCRFLLPTGRGWTQIMDLHVQGINHLSCAIEGCSPVLRDVPPHPCAPSSNVLLPPRSRSEERQPRRSVRAC